MTRYRLAPTATQERILLAHCAHARFVWNLAVEQHSWWRSGRGSAPGYCEQARQLTEARAEFEWLRVARSSGKDQRRVYQPALLGMRARRSEQP